MDVRQLDRGHVLVVPKRHIPDIFALEDADGALLMNAVTRVSRAVLAAFAPDGVSIWQSNRAAAGQEVFHLHVHIVPRHHGDGMLRVYPRRVEPATRSELDEQAASIRAHT
jgi:histidine triad (HIT) family protein